MPTEIIKGSLFRSGDLQKAINGCQVVIHAAANTKQWPTAYECYEKPNVEATSLLLEESMKAGVERFIFVSSANAFGPGTRKIPGDETSAFTSLQYQSGYMRSKYEAQKRVLEFVRQHHFPAVVVNPTFMLGKYDLKPGSGQILLMAHGKRLMPCPTGGKNFIHVKDAAAGIINAIQRGKPGNCYLLANENLSYQEFYRKMNTVCGFPRYLIKLPRPLISAAGLAGSFTEKIRGKANRLNYINARLLCAENYYSAKKAVQELQLPQTPIDQAIKEALEWFEQQGYLGKADQ